MSKDPTTAPISKKHIISASSASESIQKELTSLDSKLRRLASDHRIQTSPYILTVPSERPYHLDKRLANDWKKGTPFDDSEEQLQYLSFLAEWDHGLITPVGAWDNEKGGMDSYSQSGRSTAGTPTVGAKKQKITLSEYKKKLPTSKADDSRKQSNGPTSTPGIEKAAMSSGNSQAIKRPRDEALGLESSKSDLVGTDAPSSKRIKPSPSPSPTPVKKESEKATSSIEFPPELSPSLPPAIEKELKRLETLSSLDGLGSVKVSDQKLSARQESRTSSTGSTKEKPTIPTKTNGTLKPTITNNSQKSDRPSSTAANTLDVFGRPQTQLSIKKKTEPVFKKLVKLKIPRRIRPNLIKLLKMRPKNERPEASKGPQTDGREGKVVNKSLQPVAGEKRPRQDNSSDGVAPVQKRPRAPSNLDLSSKPTTPVPSAFKSPVISHHGSAQKGKSSTPSVSHQDGASTPQGAVRNGTPSAPDSVDRTNKDGKQNAAGFARERSTKEILSNLHRTQHSHHQMGRKLKHGCDKELEQSKDSSQAKKKAIALGIESLLCFMLAYAIRDEIFRITRPTPREATWTTIFPYIAKMKHVSEPFPHLRGLCAQLEAVCHTAAFNGECERSQQHPSSPVSSKDLVRHFQSASELFVEGTTELSVNDLQNWFPNSWMNKAKAPLARHNGSFDMKIDGKFYLPLTSITTGIEAVRAGKSLLTEWCLREGVQWEASITSKPPPKDDGK